ncbi:MAG: CPBP family intramembrane glutamic endopeptidase [Planctomycetota bacterium]|nr:CPBP family intramembrane glutamic endopeptidase [Planctomycetota bacterium]
MRVPIILALALLLIGAPSVMAFTPIEHVPAAGDALDLAPQGDAFSPGATAGRASPSASLIVWWSVLAVVCTACLVALWRRDVIRPGSFAKLAPRDLGPWPSIFWLMATLALLVVGTIAAAMTMWIVGVDAARPEAMTTRQAAIIGLVHQVCVLIAALGVVITIGRMPPSRGLAAARDAGLWFRPRDIVLGFAGIALCLPVTLAASQLAMMIHRLTTRASGETLAHDTLRRLVHDADTWAWVSAATAVLVAPIAEELLYRGFLQSSLLKASGRAWTAILGTSVMFTLMHASVTSGWYALVQIFALSVGLGIAFERTRSLGVPVVMHVCFNAANVALALAMHAK